MKSMLVIGLGDYGQHLCRNLAEMGNEVLAVDKSEDAVDSVENFTSSRLIADCTSRHVLEGLGVSDFDMCFVCIGTNFRSNMIIVSTLQELGAKYIVSEADDAMLEKLLLNNGANEVIHPNRDSALRAAVKYSSENVFDYVTLRGGYSIYEITPLPEWVGKSIRDSHIRTRYDTYIIGINKPDDSSNMMPSPDTIISHDDKLYILAHENTMQGLWKKLLED